MTNPFESAITFLTTWMNSRGEGSERNQAASAIRVLEAGGKVDKIGCAVELAGCGCRYCNQLRNVVAALPDGEKK